MSQLTILSVGHEASTRAERNAAQQLSPRKRLVHKVEPEVVTHALWAGMVIDVLDPSLELRVRLVSEIETRISMPPRQRMQETAESRAQYRVAMRGLAGRLRRRHCGYGTVDVSAGVFQGPDRSGTMRGRSGTDGVAGKVALLSLPLLPVLLQMPPLTPRPGVSPPERVTESGSESDRGRA